MVEGGDLHPRFVKPQAVLLCDTEFRVDDTRGSDPPQADDDLRLDEGSLGDRKSVV